jgi:hypothetical protein
VQSLEELAVRCHDKHLRNAASFGFDHHRRGAARASTARLGQNGQASEAGDLAL